MKSTETYVFKRKERTWFPYENEHGIESWRISAKKNVYYHAGDPSCVKNRNSNFSPDLIDYTSVELNDAVQNILIDFGVRFF